MGRCVLWSLVGLDWGAMAWKLQTKTLTLKKRKWVTDKLLQALRTCVEQNLPSLPSRFVLLHAEVVPEPASLRLPVFAWFGQRA